MRERVVHFFKSYWIWMIIILVMFGIQLNMSSESRRVQNNNDKLRDSIRHYKLDNDQVVASKSVVEYDLAEAENRLKEQGESMDLLSKKFATIKSTVKIVTITKIDTMTVAYQVPAPCDFTRTGSKDAKHYSFDYESNEKGFTVGNFRLPDTVSVVKGTKRKWILGKKQNTIDVMHSNPYISDTHIDAFDVIDKTKWYESKAFYFGLGVLGGALISK